MAKTVSQQLRELRKEVLRLKSLKTESFELERQTLIAAFEKDIAKLTGKAERGAKQ